MDPCPRCLSSSFQRVPLNGDLTNLGACAFCAPYPLVYRNSKHTHHTTVAGCHGEANVVQLNTPKK